MQRFLSCCLSALYRIHRDRQWLSDPSKSWIIIHEYFKVQCETAFNFMPWEMTRLPSRMKLSRDEVASVRNFLYKSLPPWVLNSEPPEINPFVEFIGLSKSTNFNPGHSCFLPPVFFASKRSLIAFILESRAFVKFSWFSRSYLIWLYTESENEDKKSAAVKIQLIYTYHFAPHNLFTFNYFTCLTCPPSSNALESLFKSWAVELTLAKSYF